MNHPDENQLIALYHGDAENAAAIGDHLRSCPSCRGNFETLGQVLAMMHELQVPDRGLSYGAKVWQRVAPRLRDRMSPRPHSSGAPFAFWRWVAAGVAVAAIASVVFIVRYRPKPKVGPAVPNAMLIRQRVLLDAVSQHLGRVEVLLMELENAGESSAPRSPRASSGAVNISSERELASELLASNRLYLQAARQADDAGLSNVLRSLEPVLLEISHAPARLSPQELQPMRDRTQRAGILFEVRVASSDARARESALFARGEQGQS